MPTGYSELRVTDCKSERAGLEWWEELSEPGGERVVMPQEFAARGVRGLAQPAVKCCGRGCLRIIYGSDNGAGEPDRPPRTVGGRQAIAGSARVRHWNRGAGAVPAARGAPARARVRLWRAGPGERACGSEAGLRRGRCGHRRLGSTVGLRARKGESVQPLCAPSAVEPLPSVLSFDRKRPSRVTA